MNDILSEHNKECSVVTSHIVIAGRPRASDCNQYERRSAELCALHNPRLTLLLPTGQIIGAKHVVRYIQRWTDE